MSGTQRIYFGLAMVIVAEAIFIALQIVYFAR